MRGDSVEHRAESPSPEEIQREAWRRLGFQWPYLQRIPVREAAQEVENIKGSGAKEYMRSVLRARKHPESMQGKINPYKMTGDEGDIASFNTLPYIRGLAQLRAEQAATPEQRDAFIRGLGDKAQDPVVVTGSSNYYDSDENIISLKPEASVASMLHEAAHAGGRRRMYDRGLERAERSTPDHPLSRAQAQVAHVTGETISMVPETIWAGTAQKGAEQYWPYKHMLTHGPVLGGDVEQDTKQVRAWADKAHNPATTLGKMMLQWTTAPQPQFDTKRMKAFIDGPINSRPPGPDVPVPLNLVDKARSVGSTPKARYKAIYNMMRNLQDRSKAEGKD